MRQKIFIVTLLTALHLMPAKAQLLVGSVVGGDVSKIYFFDQSNYDNFKSRPSLGFDGGFMGQMRVHRNFLLNAQLLFTYRSKYIVGTGDPRADPQFKLSANMKYIELPIFYVLEFKSLTGKSKGKGGKIKTYNWFVGGGPTISYWLSNKTRLRSTFVLENNIDHIDYSTVFGSDNSSSGQAIDSNKEFISNANRFQFAINITGGLAFEPVGFHKIVTSVQLNIAQTFLGKSDVSLPTYDIDVLRAKNHSIRISVAYLFDTKLQDRKKGKTTIKDAPSRKKK